MSTALVIIGTAIVCMAPSVLLFLALHGAALREQRVENAFRIRDLEHDAERHVTECGHVARFVIEIPADHERSNAR